MTVSVVRYFSLLCLIAAAASIAMVDGLTATLLLLTTFIFAIVCRYSERYMRGDAGQHRFTLWLCLTGISIFCVILAQNLLYFAIAWSATSFGLHELLTFYRDRPGAVLPARKKFVISRLGDACLVAVLIATYRTFGTWDFHRLFQLAQAIRESAGPIPRSVTGSCVLLVLAACLKSAQFPFHTWLPDTMETPTPVSALMHAGIINAGGILVIRLSPVITLSPLALDVLCFVGAFTALFGSVVMLTQASIKRSLAFSTVAQMGFMMLECGLGAFHLALLHLVAHSLYKSHAFLSSGGAVLTQKKAARKAPGALSISAGVVSVAIVTISASNSFPEVQPVLCGIFALAIMQMMWYEAWLTALSVACLAVVLYLGLERYAATLATPAIRTDAWVTTSILISFTVVAVAVTQLRRISQSSFGRHVYVLARNGFYLNTLANRLAAGRLT